MAVLAPGTIDLRHNNALNAARAERISAPVTATVMSNWVEICVRRQREVPAGDEDLADQDRVAWPNKKFLTDRFGRSTGRAVAALAHCFKIADTGNLQRLIIGVRYYDLFRAAPNRRMHRDRCQPVCKSAVRGTGAYIVESRIGKAHQ